MNIWDLLSLKGKVAVVTGGGRKYGLSCTRGLAEAGAKVVIASRDMENNNARAEELRKEGLDVATEHLDMGDAASITALRDKVVSDNGKVDILVHSARSVNMLSFDDPIENWEASEKINSTGYFLVMRLFLEQMKKQNHGNIINIASIYGVTGQDPKLYDGTDMKSAPDYWFQKGGMINLSRYLATQFAGYNIRVNCISPGGYFADQPRVFLDNYNSRVPLGRMANEDDIKGAVVYLASEASSYVTGQNIMLDGGWTIW